MVLDLITGMAVGVHYFRVAIDVLSARKRPIFCLKRGLNKGGDLMHESFNFKRAFHSSR
jgi:hypothetical protein